MLASSPVFPQSLLLANKKIAPVCARITCQCLVFLSQVYYTLNSTLVNPKSLFFSFKKLSLIKV